MSQMLETLRGMGQRTAHTLAWILALFSVSLGATILIAPAGAVQRPSLQEAFLFAPAHIWAIGWVTLGIWTSLALLFNDQAAPLPLYGTALLTSAFGFFTIPPLTDGSGGIFGVYTFVALAACALLAGYSIGQEEP